MPKERLDLYLTAKNLAESRSQAQRLIMAGQVFVDGQMVLKAGTKISPDAEITIKELPKYVSRGGEKLSAALEIFSVGVSGKVCADVGSSTGGFTDCLLQNGAKRVYAIDVGKGILHWKIRQNPQVVVLEETNARYLNRLPESVELISVDASFISLKKLLPVFKGWFSHEGEGNNGQAGAKTGDVIALIKPQFEAGRKEAARGQGVIRDPSIHKQVLLDILGFARECGYHIEGLMRSPLTGPKGNIEFFAWLVYGIRKAGGSGQSTLSQNNLYIEKLTEEALN